MNGVFADFIYPRGLSSTVSERLRKLVDLVDSLMVQSSGESARARYSRFGTIAVFIALE